jgi:hypothetical protein
MDWRNAGLRTRLGPVDGSVMAPIVLCGVVFHWLTIGFLLLYAGGNLYITYRGRSMVWVIRRARFYLRDGVILARTSSYWRQFHA